MIFRVNLFHFFFHWNYHISNPQNLFMLNHIVVTLNKSLSQQLLILPLFPFSSSKNHWFNCLYQFVSRSVAAYISQLSKYHADTQFDIRFWPTVNTKQLFEVLIGLLLRKGHCWERNLANWQEPLYYWKKHVPTDLNPIIFANPLGNFHGVSLKIPQVTSLFLQW